MLFAAADSVLPFAADNVPNAAVGLEGTVSAPAAVEDLVSAAVVAAAAAAAVVVAVVDVVDVVAAAVVVVVAAAAPIAAAVQSAFAAVDLVSFVAEQVSSFAAG